MDKNSVVSKADLNKLKPYLRAMLEERKNLYDEVEASHLDLLTLLENKMAGRKAFIFSDDQVNLMLSKALKGRNTCLAVDFEKSPEVERTMVFFEKFFSW